MRTITNEFETVSNFKEVAEMLFGDKVRPLTEDEFYFLQILVRGKDGNHVSGNNKNRLVKYYLIHNKEQLFDLQFEIETICYATNGRAYIHPTRRSFRDVANITLELTAHTYVSQNWIGLRGTYSTACGKSYVTNDKKFIVDCDDLKPGDEKYEEMKSFIKTLKGRGAAKDRIVAEIETMNGYHLITLPFDTKTFGDKYPEIDVHKNNPTLLYYRKPI